MKLAIVGSRTFNDEQLMDEMLTLHFPWSSDQVSECVALQAIISGGAKGADTLAKKLADDYQLEYLEFLPDWESNGKAAGFIRNKEIVNACDMVLAFWDGKSKGTEHTIKLARLAKKPTFIVYF